MGLLKTAPKALSDGKLSQTKLSQKKLSTAQLTNMQAQGLRWIDADHTDTQGTGLTRQGGAGPTDHKALNFTSQTSMIPIFNEQVGQSPYSAQRTDDEQVLIFEHEKPIAKVKAPEEPRFYQLTTADGIPYRQIATLHSKNVLATTVLQTCVRYRNRDTSCQFCAIEESLKNGKTIERKTPEQLAEVAKAAVELDGIQQIIMTTGTPKTSDRGAALLAESARAIRAVVDIPIQAQCEPPDSDDWFVTLKEAGVDALGMHMEAVTDRVRKSIMPGKASVSMERYMEAYKAAVAVFGPGNVSTYILAGLGDTEAEILAMSEQLIDIGVYPFVVPFVPVASTPLENHPMPDPEMMHRLLSKLGPAIAARGITSDSTKAGCAKCGACSTLKSYEQSEANASNAKDQYNGGQHYA